MGIDLKVMASYLRERRGEVLPTATLRFERDSELFARLSKESIPRLVHPLPLGLKLGHFEDDGLVFSEVDRYGRPLTCTTSVDLAALEAPDGLSTWNRAVLAFLTALPVDVRIVFYWC